MKIVLPEKLTEEEELLLKKYALFKKKKKELLEWKSKQAQAEAEQREKEETTIVPSEEAREVAKRLVKSGKIKIKVRGKNRIITKKGRELEKSSIDYQPYSPSRNSDNDAEEDVEETYPAKKLKKSLYDNFVSSGSVSASTDSISPQLTEAVNISPDSNESHQKKTNTVFVTGYNINADTIRQEFLSAGNVVHVNISKARNPGFYQQPRIFVTFENSDSANRAVEQFDGQLVHGSVIQVKLARKQPVFRMGSSSYNAVGNWSNLSNQWDGQMQADPETTSAKTDLDFPRNSDSSLLDSANPENSFSVQDSSDRAKPTPVTSPSVTENSITTHRYQVSYSDQEMFALEDEEEECVVEPPRIEDLEVIH